MHALNSSICLLLSLMLQYLLLSLICLGGGANIQDDECQNHNSNRLSGCSGPPIRFPFWIKDRQPQHCGSPAFAISCTNKGHMFMELPTGIRLLVKHIDYRNQSLHLQDSLGCLPGLLPRLNLSASPFLFNLNPPHNLLFNYTLFNCSSIQGYRVIAVGDDAFYFDDRIIHCKRISNTLTIPDEAVFNFHINELHLRWLEPRCGQCEARRQRCRFNTNSSSTWQGTECFGFIKQQQHTGDTTRLIRIMGIAIASILLPLIIIGLCYVYHVYRREKLGHKKLETFLEDYRSQKPSRYSYADIKRITSQFAENLGQGGFGTVFKGRLSNDVLVAVKVLNDFKGNGEDFISEVSSMCRIHHVNITRLVGFCAHGSHRALIYEYLSNESLEKFIFTNNTQKNHLLSWDILYNIALGVAKGMEYLHQGCEQQILHFDIKPHNILLGHNFNPKISDFGMAKLCSRDQSAVSMTRARGTMGYMAPEVVSRNFGKVSYKSDVYSYGMLLLEMVGGRSNIDATVERTSQVYFPEWVYGRFERGEDLGIVVEDEEQGELVKKLTIIGLWCIQWYPVDRPSMKVVVQMLEGAASSLTKPANPFPTTDAMGVVYRRAKEPFDRDNLPAILEENWIT